MKIQRPRRPWWRRLRPIEMDWPVSDFCLPHEWAREIRFECLVFEFRFAALDHLLAPRCRLRVRSLRWGLLRR